MWKRKRGSLSDDRTREEIGRKPHFLTRQNFKKNTQTVTKDTSTVSPLTELHKIANGVLRKAEHTLHHGVLYFKKCAVSRYTRNCRVQWRSTA